MNGSKRRQEYLIINNHNNDRRLGGPNADAIERIKALTRPKMVQAPKLPDMYPVHDIPPKHLYEPVVAEGVPTDTAFIVDFKRIGEEMKGGKLFEDATKDNAVAIKNIDFGERRKFL